MIDRDRRTRKPVPEQAVCGARQTRCGGDSHPQATLLNIAARLMRSAPQPQVLKNAALCIAKLMEQNRPAELARRRLRKDSRQPHRRAVGLRIGSTATVI